MSFDDLFDHRGFFFQLFSSRVTRFRGIDTLLTPANAATVLGIFYGASRGGGRVHTYLVYTYLPGAIPEAGPSTNGYLKGATDSFTGF